MTENMSVIISGFGGQGALLAGVILCHAAVLEGKHTTWFPSYGAEMRGGAVNCSVNISSDDVPSPIIDKADVVIALNDASQIKFEKRVKKGGFMIINSSLSHVNTTRDDIEYLKIPVNDFAQKLTQPSFINVMALGAFIEIALISELLSDKLFKIISRALSYFLYSPCSKEGFWSKNTILYESGAILIKDNSRFNFTYLLFVVTISLFEPSFNCLMFLSFLYLNL